MHMIRYSKPGHDTAGSRFPHQQWSSIPDAGNDSWVLSLSDLMTLMLVFFLIWTTLKMDRIKALPVPTQPNHTAMTGPARDLESILMNMAPVQHRKGNLIMVLEENLTFDPGSAALSETGRAVIARIGAILSHETGYELEILGHTDNTPISPDSPWRSNIELSMARAAAVFNALAETGVSPVLMKVQGLGALFPIRHQNGEIIPMSSRRVELVLRPAH